MVYILKYDIVELAGVEPEINLDDVNFEPIVSERPFRPHRHQEKNILDLAFAPRSELVFPPLDVENCKNTCTFRKKAVPLHPFS